jgi:probable H4MPT-linked C1 transfer pathway protein
MWISTWSAAMSIEVVGWDVGGAHLKAAAADGAGRILAVAQEPCPLWQGLDRLHSALDRMFARLSPPPGCRHAVTMTGELADLFPDRAAGVSALVEAMAGRCPPGSTWIYAGPRGLIPAAALRPEDAALVASANWMASGAFAAASLAEALFIDIGSTTTDIFPVCGHRVNNRGYTDYERMRYDELLYTGIVRTPVMAVAERAPFEGEWIGLMAEHFATMADVYRLTGELPEPADQLPAADGGEKTPAASRRRLARLFGRDADSAPPERWRGAARFLREQQLARLRLAVERQWSRGTLSDAAPVVGAGVGRFLARELAGRLQLAYLDFSDLFAMPTPEPRIADCAPAAALACLALREASGA